MARGLDGNGQQTSRLKWFDIRIDHRGYRKQGIDLIPQKKIGPENAIHRISAMEDHQKIARENGEKIFADPTIAFDALTRQQSTFTYQDIARFVNRHSVDREQFQPVYDKVLGCEELVHLGQDEKGRDRFTTKEMLNLEKNMIKKAEGLSKDLNHAIDQNQFEKILLEKNLSEQQKDVLQHITEKGDLKCAIGYAGTGKSYLLGAAKELWEAQGFNVQGATLSGIAAENLQGSSGIESRTLASHCYYWDKGERLMTDKDILVIDEAGMLGSRQLERVMDEVSKANAKVVLIGDPQQLQAIEAGAAFRAIAEKVPTVELTEIRRQQEPWQQQATKEFALRQTEQALERYQIHDHVHEFETMAAAKQALVEQWNDARITDPEKTQIMLCYTRKDALELNQIARGMRQHLGDHQLQITLDLEN